MIVELPGIHESVYVNPYYVVRVESVYDKPEQADITLARKDATIRIKLPPDLVRQVLNRGY
jgi:hypothetical protein